MAQQIITTILRVDDLDGTELGESGHTIEWEWEGKTYAIDLSDKNAEKFRNAMGQYVEHARTVQREQHTGRGHRRRTSSGSSAHNPEETKAARAWLIAQGDLKPDSRGRISGELWEKYRRRGIPTQQTSSNTPAKAQPAAKAEPAKTEPAKAANAGPAKKAEPAKAQPANA